MDDQEKEVKEALDQLIKAWLEYRKSCDEYIAKLATDKEIEA